MGLTDGHMCKPKDFKEWVTVKDICESLGYDVYRADVETIDTYNDYPYIIYGSAQIQGGGALCSELLSVSEFLRIAAHLTLEPYKYIRRYEIGVG